MRVPLQTLIRRETLKMTKPRQSSQHYINSKRKTDSDIGDLIHVDDSGNTSVANTDELKAEFLCKAFSSVFTPEKDIDTCQLPDDNRGV